MARGLYLSSLVLMLFLLCRLTLVQNRRGSYKENIREKIEEQHEKREHREEKKEAVGWRRRKRSVQVSRPELSKMEATNFFNGYNHGDDY